MDYRIFPPQQLLQTRTSLPLSKSESNRALIISALTPGGNMPAVVAECDDTAAMLSVLNSLDSRG